MLAALLMLGMGDLFIGTGEFVPVSLLPDIAATTRIGWRFVFVTHRRHRSNERLQFLRTIEANVPPNWTSI